MRPLSEDFSIRKLEGYDFDQIGEEIANAIAVMNAIHDAVKHIPLRDER